MQGLRYVNRYMSGLPKHFFIIANCTLNNIHWLILGTIIFKIPMPSSQTNLTAPHIVYSFSFHYEIPLWILDLSCLQNSPPWGSLPWKPPAPSILLCSLNPLSWPCHARHTSRCACLVELLSADTTPSVISVEPKGWSLRADLRSYLTWKDKLGQSESLPWEFRCGNNKKIKQLIAWPEMGKFHEVESGP